MNLQIKACSAKYMTSSATSSGLITTIERSLLHSRQPIGFDFDSKERFIRDSSAAFNRKLAASPFLDEDESPFMTTDLKDKRDGSLEPPEGAMEKTPTQHIQHKPHATREEKTKI